MARAAGHRFHHLIVNFLAPSLGDHRPHVDLVRQRSLDDFMRALFRQTSRSGQRIAQAAPQFEAL